MNKSKLAASVVAVAMVLTSSMASAFTVELKWINVTNSQGEGGFAPTGDISFEWDGVNLEGNGTWTGKVKMGTPHVVDLGRELEYAPQANGAGDTTKRVYMVADGAREEVDSYAPQTW